MQLTATRDIAFAIRRQRLDENYCPAPNTRLTTNFANLARGERRRENLRNVLQMITNRFNDLASWDNPRRDRYGVELDIISVDLEISGEIAPLPLIEMLQTTVLDHKAGKAMAGLVGNNFSSYVRDYDFSIVLPRHNQGREGFSVPEGFGELHGKLFKAFITSDVFSLHFSKLPVICLSVSDAKTYHCTTNRHPILGSEYESDDSSLTEQYFLKMGMQVRYFMPRGCSAPLAISFFGDLLNDYSNLELIGTISTMETFQRIYRPEIYNAHCAAGESFRPSLKHPDHSLTRIAYDREERSRLALAQGRLAEEQFIRPHGALVARWLDQILDPTGKKARP